MSENGEYPAARGSIMAPMRLDPTTCYRALRARDARFDGRFFVAVSSTRIYCRPVCTVRPPRRENCRYYPSAAAAESAGYRPCLRCRPELAPGSATIDAVQRTARATARLIEEGSVNEEGIEAAAARLGITDRHLRRAFQAEFGVSPVAFAQTQRLLLAKQLLTDTRMPVTEVAYASGFGSVRRFNALFRERYRLRPRELRKASLPAATGDALAFELGYRPPYDWGAIAGFLGARAVAGIEACDGAAYRRTVRVASGGAWHGGWVEIAPAPGKPALRVRIAASLGKALPQVLARVKSLMDLSCHPAEVARALGPLAAQRPGMRVPGAFDGFEIALRAVLGQQVSVAAARTLACRFAEAFGERIETPFDSLNRVFPTAERIAALPYRRIARLGVPAARARTIVALARAAAHGGLDLAPGADVEATLAKLRALPGVGEWTAQYVALRALAWPDAFPHTDHGVMKAMKLTDPKRVLAAAEGWRPWRAYAVMHLWQSLARAERKGERK
jgi:AraC family transcriptional regulator, regulatory protein of adaptative response / DNA-3-methyladenine glycosylase II